jgi:hypothetical protein
VDCVAPDIAEFIIGPAEGRTRWLYPGYEGLIFGPRKIFQGVGDLASLSSPVWKIFLFLSDPNHRLLVCILSRKRGRWPRH